MDKPNVVDMNGTVKFVDPEYVYRYTGCGLIAQIPWKLVKLENAAKIST
jgi:hypothetical protein